MKMTMKKVLSLLLAVCLVFGIAACGGDGGDKKADTSEVAGDYYIDLSELGMNLTVYLRLDGEGNFVFSNTPTFETDKGSGTFTLSDGQYILVYTSVNGEEKSISDGITSSFVLTDDGALDFSVCERIYYGSAGATTVSEDDPNLKLMGKIISADFDAPDTESEFTAGTYKAADIKDGGNTYTHYISFFEDNTYIHVISCKNGIVSETGIYGISTTVLALTPDGADRTESEVVDAENLKVSVLPSVGATERQLVEFKKTDASDKIATLSGSGTVKGSSDTFDADITVYKDGTYIAKANGFEEKGIIMLNTEDGTMKQYPDHPETKARGLNQVSTVPSGSCDFEGGLSISSLRVRTSDALSRNECDVK